MVFKTDVQYWRILHDVSATACTWQFKEIAMKVYPHKYNTLPVWCLVFEHCAYNHDIIVVD